MKLNIKKIRSILNNCYLIAVRESLFDKDIFYALKEAGKKEKLEPEPLGGEMAVGFFAFNEKTITFKMVDGKLIMSSGSNPFFFNNWEEFRHLGNNDFFSAGFINPTNGGRTFYLTDYKNLLLDDEELE